jgi:hypothetical protein
MRIAYQYPVGSYLNDFINVFLHFQSVLRSPILLMRFRVKILIKFQLRTKPKFLRRTKVNLRAENIFLLSLLYDFKS